MNEDDKKREIARGQIIKKINHNGMLS